MGNSIYKINKGANEPVKFKGLRAQYIWYLGGGLVLLMLAFAVLYMVGLNAFVCIGIIGIAGAVLFTRVYKMSNTYGEHGLMKKTAHRLLPTVIKLNSRKAFIK